MYIGYIVQCGSRQSVGIPKKGNIVSQSKYFGKSFVAVPMLGSTGHKLTIFDNLHAAESFTPERGGEWDEAILGLVDTLRVTHKLLVMLSRKLGVRITDANEFHREMIVATARKIGESPEDVRVIVEPIMTVLFQEMIAKQPGNKRK